MIFKTNQMFWDANNSTGYRMVTIEYNDRILMAVAAQNVSGEWTARVVPMGYSFEYSEVQAFSELFSVLSSLMNFMCRDDLTFDEMNDYLLTIQH